MNKVTEKEFLKAYQDYAEHKTHTYYYMHWYEVANAYAMTLLGLIEDTPVEEVKAEPVAEKPVAAESAKEPVAEASRFEYKNKNSWKK